MREDKGRSWQDTASDWLISIIIAVALAFLIRMFIFEPYMVEGTSMYPTLISHERLIVTKYNYLIGEPKRGEIIVFRYPKDESRDFIKRVIAVGGDTIEMRDGKVLVNGSKVEEPYTWKDDPKGPNRSNYRKSVVPQGHIFVLGDNRNNSEDSRFADVDFVPLALIKGKAAISFWPVAKLSILP